MIKLKLAEMNEILPLLSGKNDSLIRSAIQGCMGEIWCDDLKNPQTLQIIVADFGFLIGEAKRRFVRHLPSTYQGEIIVFVPENEAWSIMIEEEYGDRCKKIKRYALKKNQHDFDLDKLRENFACLPEGYTIKAIEERDYHELNTHEWSKDLCCQFSTFDKFNSKGMGYIITHQETIVCGASSYSIFNNGIEIEIDTKIEHRRHGLALACASRLILECLEKGIEPSWDAANLASVSLSEKLGYHFDKEYEAYVVQLR